MEQEIEVTLELRKEEIMQVIKPKIEGYGTVYKKDGTVSRAEENKDGDNT